MPYALCNQQPIWLFDPTLPLEGNELDAVELRAQFNALKALIDAQDGSIANLNATVSAQTAEIAGLQVPVPTAVQILGALVSFERWDDAGGFRADGGESTPPPRSLRHLCLHDAGSAIGVGG